MRGWAMVLPLAIWSVCGVIVAQAPPGANKELFGLTKLHTVDVIVSAEAYAAMEPPPRAMGGPPSPVPGGPGRPAPGSPDFGAGNFGFEFNFVRAKVVFDGQPLDEVGLRYKGSGTYMMSARQAKRSLKIDFDRHNPKQTLQGTKKLNLNSGVMDPTKAREVLAYTVFETVGIPCPRTALAEVTLTVPGKYDREYLGAFTIVEQVDKAFLKRHFQNDQGLLLKPEGIRGLPHFGDDPKAYEATYTPKTDGSEADWKKLVELTRLINSPDEAKFRAEIANYLDLDNFANFLAANTALASMDGFIGMGHNYYLYCVPATGKFVFLPWDLDLAFGAFPLYGNPAQLVDLSIEHPHVGDSKLIDRLLAMPDFKAKYRAQLTRLSNEVFVPARLGQDVATLTEALKGLLAKEKAATDARKEGNGIPGGGMFGAAPLPLPTFIEKRKLSIDKQLAGEVKGYMPSPGMMMGGGPPRIPPVGPILARPLLENMDTNKDGKVSEEEFASGARAFSRAWDRDQNGQLDERELAEGLQKLVPMGR